MKSCRCGLTLVVVRDLREHRGRATEDELTDFDTDVLAESVLARTSAGLTDSTIERQLQARSGGVARPNGSSRLRRRLLYVSPGNPTEEAIAAYKPRSWVSS